MGAGENIECEEIWVGDSSGVNLENFLGVVFLCSLVVFFGDFHGFLADFLSYVAGKFSCGLNFWTFENVGSILVAEF